MASLLFFYCLIVLVNRAAAFLAFANVFSSKISCSSFIFSKSAADIKTSPRTIRFTFSFNFLGIFLIVLRFAVTSSPTCPFPRVAPLTNSPSIYSIATDNPSIFASTVYSIFSSFVSFLTLVSNSLKSSIVNTSCKL